MRNRFHIAWLLVVLVACQSEPKGRPDAYYLKTGDSLSAAAFQTIRGALQTAIADSGVDKAIRFCQLNALALTHKLNTDSIKIERLTERYRNSQNQLTDESKAIWDTYKTKLAAGDSIQPLVVRTANQVDYYKPILLQPMCLTCHGQPSSNIPASLVATIDSLYPNDLAKGFSVGELRGIWQIRFQLP
jgi:hypothetical protein